MSLWQRLRGCLLQTALLPTLTLGHCGVDAPAGYQGWIEGDAILVGAEEPGRLATLDADEGAEVSPGMLLFTIDSSVASANEANAESALAEARAGLARMQAAHDRPEEIAVLQATRRQIEASLALSKSELDRARNLVRSGASSQERVEQMQAAYDRDRAQLDETQRRIEVASLPGRQEDLDRMQAMVSQAQAKLAEAQARLARFQVRATVAGRLTQVYYRAGEVVPLGRPVIAIQPPANKRIRFFVGEDQLARIRVGDSVSVTCDSCAAGLEGAVSYIAPQAEYTPPVIYSLDERHKLVYRIEAHPDQPDALAVGQPVSVQLLGTHRQQPGNVSARR